MQILIFLFTLYFFVIGFCGMWRRKENKIKTPKKTFALVVAAHNEEVVIGDLVENLKQLNYPKDMYDIYVIADNCTDKTAEKARAAGAIVLEHQDDDPKHHKVAYPLAYGIDYLLKSEKKYDFLIRIDADNHLKADFFQRMNDAFCSGVEIARPYEASKNPTQNAWSVVSAT